MLWVGMGTNLKENVGLSFTIDVRSPPLSIHYCITCIGRALFLSASFMHLLISASTHETIHKRSWELFRVASTFAGAVALVNFGLSLWLVMIFGLPFTHLHVMMLPLVQAVSWIYHHCNVVEVTQADAHKNYGSHVVGCNICIGLLQCHPIHVVFVCIV